MIITYWIIALFMAFSGVSGTVGATTLTEKQLAAHGHKIAGYVGDNSYGEYNDTAAKYGNEANIQTDTTGSSASHTHTLSGIKSGSASSLPPYYALAYIMRCA